MIVLLDLDGTLSDPLLGFVNCVRHALDSLEFSLADDTRLESYIGPPLHQSFRDICGDDDIAAQAVRLYRERYSRSGIFENRLYEGIEQCLAELARAGTRKFVATSKPTIFSQKIVEHFAIDHHFDRVYGSNLDGTLADKTELLAHILERENIDPRDAVMIGDRKFDMIGAKNHGLRAIGVLWGYGSRDELLEAGADAVCRHPRELTRLLDDKVVAGSKSYV